VNARIMLAFFAEINASSNEPNARHVSISRGMEVAIAGV
jgi:hypothetical protein